MGTGPCGANRRQWSQRFQALAGTVVQLDSPRRARPTVFQPTRGVRQRLARRVVPAGQKVTVARLEDGLRRLGTPRIEDHDIRLILEAHFIPELRDAVDAALDGVGDL